MASASVNIHTGLTGACALNTIWLFPFLPFLLQKKLKKQKNPRPLVGILHILKAVSCQSISQTCFFSYLAHRSPATREGEPEGWREFMILT